MLYPFKVMNRKKLLLHQINAFITNMFIYILPVLIAFLTKDPFTGENFLKLIILIGCSCIAEVFFCHLWFRYTYAFVITEVKNVQIKYFNRINNMSLSKLNEVHSGFLKKQIDIVSEGIEDFTERLRDNVNGTLLSCSIFLATVLIQDVTMFFVCLGFIGIIIGINIYMGKKIVPVQQNYNEHFSNYNGTYVDLLQNIKTIKKLDADGYCEYKIEEDFKPVGKKLPKLYTLISLRFNGIEFLVSVMFVSILISLYFKMRQGENILPFLIFYITMFTGLKSELRSFSKVFQSYTKLKSANDQIEEIIGETTKEEVIKDWKKIKIKSIKFKYTKDAKEQIYIPKFTLERKDKISIIGESGQGKTTFLNILSRFLKPENGSYTIDGKKKEGKLDIAYVSQDVDLLNISIKDNICLGKKIKEGFLEEMLEAAGLKRWIDKLPEGLNTIVGERGLKLSAGQKQRINIIRGIILDKQIYILDEPTSNLDAKTEERIIKLVDRYLKDKTVIIVTHRLEVQKICNKHYIFENNTMKEKLF